MRWTEHAARPALEGRRLLLGVSGSIAAYKALDLASRLKKSSASLDVLLTRAAAELVRPLAFQAITHGSVAEDLWQPGSELAMDHIAMADRAEAFVIAPATADLIARLSLGLAGDALTTTALACEAPLLIAPAMEPKMWAHPATVEHVARLRERGATFVGPEPGRLASGKSGLGRMAEPARIEAELRAVLGRTKGLAGRQLVISAGPTREALDPVRFLSNRSTGRMGCALAEAARDRGAAVTLIHGPICDPLPHALKCVGVTSADEMCAAVLEAAAEADALIMTAAVADYRAAEIQPSKIKKQPGDLRLELARTQDVLVALDQALEGRPRLLRIGFAAESESLLANARRKLERKSLDMIVANRVPEAFGAGRYEAQFVTEAGHEGHRAPSKAVMAEVVIDWLQNALEREEQRR